ncbi:MAG TPA: NADH-quinone oxidoreductase subunit N, partial [Thermodesulfobacteriota bacterium]|nr:NADH-quinone oxidoreductase subunit N [Thermodesulfobacteriota bacterium]
FLGLEVLSISLYILIAIRKTDAYSNEAGIKYFVMGAVSSAFLTFGIAVVYAARGTLDIARSLAAGTPLESTSLIFLGLILVLAGIAFKISMVPFHLWTPDVYQGAPAPVAAFLSTGSKVALFAALLRFAAYSGGEIWSSFRPALWIFAVLTIVAGTLSAVAQPRLKRLLAYSSVAQMGYLLMTLLSAKEMGAPAIIYYLAVYALMDLGAFGAVAILSARERDLDDLEDCRGLAFVHPWTAALLAVSLVSLAGLPPTGGFIGKFALFRAVLHSGYIVIAVIGILAAVVSVFFYFKVVVAFFMSPPRPIAAKAIAATEGVAGALILLATVWLGLFPEPVFVVIADAVLALGVR